MLFFPLESSFSQASPLYSARHFASFMYITFLLYTSHIFQQLFPQPEEQLKYVVDYNI